MEAGKFLFCLAIAQDRESLVMNPIACNASKKHSERHDAWFMEIIFMEVTQYERHALGKKMREQAYPKQKANVLANLDLVKRSNIHHNIGSMVQCGQDDWL